MHKFIEKIDEELKMLEKQLDKKDQMSVGDLEQLNKLTEAKKNILETKMYEEYSEDDGESYAGGQSYAGGSSYARGRGRNARRDSMGRYSSDDGMSYESSYAGRGGSRGDYSRDGGYSRESGYSRADGKEMMIERLEDLAETADNKSREAIHRAIKQIENA